MQILKLSRRNKMSTDSQSSVPGPRSSSREPLTATPDPVKGAWPMASSSSDRSKSVTSEADSVFSASSRPTNETTPELLDIESKASAVQHWATAQSPRTVAGDELASRLSAAAAGQQKHTRTSATPADGSSNAVPPSDTALLAITSAIPAKAVSPSATTNPSPKIPVANPTANPKEEIPRKPIIKLRRFLDPELRDRPVKKYTSKKVSRKDDSDPYNYPEGSGSETTKKKEQRRAKKLKPTPSSASPATVDNYSGDEPNKKQKLIKDQQRRAKKLKPAPSPTTYAFPSTADNASDSEYTPKPKKRKSPLPEKEQPATKKPKTKVSLPSPGSSSSSSSSTEKSTTPASSASSADRPKQHYELRAAEILRSPLDYDDCVRDDARPGKAQRIRRVFRRFRREQGEPISTAIGGARNPPDPETDVGGEKWGAPYKRGGDGGILVGWVKNKARRIWGGEVNKNASEYAKKH
ncbi:hypothetical protein B0T18DRAFT_150407 [Schizothecium vesticola]|uniref:Uncharacterized protein n=1 Tax=Schizothecium vesticola TaxID=314040 RepID=A0AA40EVK1_9PEZI|nr:hypothetical protein B0T18DRAFT_150407 [Schizothecium vesticola]